MKPGKEEDVGICVECHSDQPEEYMKKSPFLGARNGVPCKFCGGPTIIARRTDKKRALENEARKRGLAQQQEHWIHTMPTYIYKCSLCEQKYDFPTNNVEYKCCNEYVVRQFTLGGISFKGSGFYSSDSKGVY